MPPVPSATTLSLRWLVRLRWVAVAGEVGTLVFAAAALNLELPWRPLLAVLAVSIAINLVLLRTLRPSTQQESVLAGVLAADILLLSVMIYHTGGASNPFSSFYLVLVTLGAMTLTARWLAGLVLLALASYLFIFFHGQPLKGPGGIGEIGCPGYGLHLKGMGVAFLLTTLCVAFFVQKMQRSLGERDVALAEAETKAARADQFSALATLAAGVAHELGTPLGTIAVASKELELSLESSPENAALEDARLIRQQVERCRSILDRLDRRSTRGVGEAPGVVTVAELASDLRSALPSTCQSRIQVTDCSQGAEWSLPRQPIVQALLILVQNACEADGENRPVDVVFATPGRNVSISVLDRGPGLSNAAQKHAGEPFFTTKPPRQGLGLGLFLVRTLALQLGGELTHQPRPGGGTLATFTVPL